MKFLMEGAPRRETAGRVKEGSWLGRLGLTGETWELQGEAGWGEAAPGTLAAISLVQREGSDHMGEGPGTMWLEFGEKTIL